MGVTMLLPTTLVGSYPQPDWLIDRHGSPRWCRGCARRISGGSMRSGSKRRRMTRRCWRSATRSAPASTSSPTASSAAKAIPTASPPRSTASTSTIPARPPTAAADFPPCRAWWGRSGASTPVEVRDVEFLRANTGRKIKMTVPGPFTMAAQCQDDYYKRRGDARPGLRRCGQCRDQGPVRGRRRYRADRRALDAVAPGKGPPIRDQGA